jgi:hypothetical protein
LDKLEGTLVLLVIHQAIAEITCTSMTSLYGSISSQFVDQNPELPPIVKTSEVFLGVFEGTLTEC